MKPPRVYLRAICAVLRALRRSPRGKYASPPELGRRAQVKLRSRRRAAVKLGGRCACCGLGLDFVNVLEFHHVRGNGRAHRDVLRALDTGLVGWIMDCTSPGSGLFALELLCVNCHRMHHEAGGCPHRMEARRRAA